MISHSTPRSLFGGFISRTIGFVLDVLLILVIAAVVRLTVQALIGFFDSIVPFFDVGQANFVESLTGFAGTSVLQLVYFVFFWAAFGQTLGMALLGLQVVRPDGSRPGVLRALARYLGYWLCFITLGLGFIWIIFDRRRQGWHDKLSGTFVVCSRDSRLYHQRVVAARRQAVATAPPMPLDPLAD